MYNLSLWIPDEVWVVIYMMLFMAIYHDDGYTTSAEKVCCFSRIVKKIHHKATNISKFTLSPPPFYSDDMVPLRSGWDFKKAIINLVLLVAIVRCYENTRRWMPWDLTGDKSPLARVLTWCHQTTCLYLGQCWLSYLLPYDVIVVQ